jgi:chitodextrinase
VYRGTSPGGESATPYATGVGGTSFNDTGVVSRTTYYYKVTAVGSGGESAPSNEAHAKAR